LVSSSLKPICLILAVALGAGACSAHPDAKAAAPAKAARDSVADSTMARAVGGEVITPSSAHGGVARPVTPADTEKLHLLSGRTRHDSTSYRSAVRAGARKLAGWPSGPAPTAGAMLPSHRIVAFYGNPLSKKMGVLGEYPPDVMLAKLDQTVAEWRRADPSTPVQPALQLIAVVAQGGPGRDGMYRLRMDTSLIEKVYGWAQQKHALLFLDVQVGHSTLQQELPRLLPFLSRPDVHLAIDPEFSMHYDREGLVPGSKIGEMDAADVNYAVRTLAQLAAEKHLPPKMLVVHRFTQKMVLNASNIRLDPHVQVVMDMDGWGPPWLKFDSYRDYEVAEPVQYTGFKIFFHNDAKKGDPLLTPLEVLRLLPHPLYIQYQ
jgi:hypothetical protein